MIVVMGMIGASELALILVLVLIFFGGSKIPEVAKSLGKGFREFKKALHEDDPNDSGPKTPRDSSKS